MVPSCENRLDYVSIQNHVGFPTKIASVVTIHLVLIFLVSTLGSLAYASPSVNNDRSPVDEDLSSNTSISSAELVHTTETLKLPAEVDEFVMLIVNEAHENWSDEKHKLITDHNAYYIPTNLIVHEGTSITFLDADAPWDTPHPHKIEIVNKRTKDVVYSSGVMNYDDTSKPVILSPGDYSVVSTEYEAKEGNILVLPDENNQERISSNEDVPNQNLIIGGFYTTTNQVENNKDNDGNSHPGNLQYYREEFEKGGFTVLSEHNFSYKKCSYCPGEFWPDNKSGEHTLIIYSTEQQLTEALDKLKRFVKDNVYI